MLFKRIISFHNDLLSVDSQITSADKLITYMVSTVNFDFSFSDAIAIRPRSQCRLPRRTHGELDVHRHGTAQVIIVYYIRDMVRGLIVLSLFMAVSNETRFR